MKTGFVRAIALACLLLLALALPAWAQSQQPQLRLEMRRDFGYGGFGGDVQGTMRLIVSGPTDLSRATLYMDGQPMGELTQAPFQLRFNTDSYPPGGHVITAVGFTASGTELRSNELHPTFLTAAQAGGATRNLIVPILGLVLAVTLISFLVPTLLSRGKHSNVPLGAARDYGVSGGAICPRCKRPFALHFLSPHIGFLKLERCPFCGKIGLFRAASRNELAAAEAAECASAAPGSPAPATSPEEELRRELDDSRFQDS